MYEIVIIGAGASGLFLAAHLKNKKNTLILEHNPQIGAKILISGGGRCNFTNKNISAQDYLGNKEFFNTIYKNFTNKAVVEYFTKRGLEYTLKNKNEYFCKNSAKDLLSILEKEIKGVNLSLNTEVLKVSKENNIFLIETNKGTIKTKKLVIASGGLSFPKLGASSIGLEIAKSFGHTIIAPAPALVGFTLQKEQSFFKELSGISVKVEIKVEDKSFFGNLLFAHKGISGPAVLNASLFWKKGKITINFLPKFNFDTIKQSNKELVSLLPLPKRVIKAFMQALNLSSKAVKNYSKEEFERLKSLQNYSFAPAGTFGFSKAEVTKGGVATKEISSCSLESKLVKNLFFLGEVIDITGRLGGYNFQWAFSSAFCCAKHITK